MMIGLYVFVLVSLTCCSTTELKHEQIIFMTTTEEISTPETIIIENTTEEVVSTEETLIEPTTEEVITTEETTTIVIETTIEEVITEEITSIIEETVIVETQPEPPIILTQPQVVTLYTMYSPEVLDVFFRTVEAEIGGGTFQQKCNIVSVIFNRMKSCGSWDLLSILVAPGQFTPVCDGTIWTKTPSAETVLACETMFANGLLYDSIGGALYFDTGGNTWASRNRTEIFFDGVIHYYR